MEKKTKVAATEPASKNSVKTREKKATTKVTKKAKVAKDKKTKKVVKKSEPKKSAEKKTKVADKKSAAASLSVSKTKKVATKKDLLEKSEKKDKSSVASKSEAEKKLAKNLPPQAENKDKEKSPPSSDKFPAKEVRVDKENSGIKKALEKGTEKNTDKQKKQEKKAVSAPSEALPKQDKQRKKFKFNNPFTEKDPIQAKMVNCIMRNGKKNLARKILRETFAEMSRKGERDTIKTFELAIANATPSMEVRPKRIGGSVYQIPLEVKPRRQQALALRWILSGARARKGQPMYRRLASELIDASRETGFAFGKKEEAHRTAAANKVFAHLARY